MRRTARAIYFGVVDARKRFANAILEAKANSDSGLSIPLAISWHFLVALYFVKRFLQNSLKRNIPRTRAGFQFARKESRSQLLVKLAAWATQPPVRYSNAYFPDHATNNRLTIHEAEEMKRQAREFADPPLISIITPVFESKPEWLFRLSRAVLDQTYSRWEWILVDDASASPETKETLCDFATWDERITVDLQTTRFGVSAATNRGIELAHGSFVCFVDHDDELLPDALWWIAKSLQNNPSLDVLYSDEELNFENADVTLPSFKPDFSPETMIGCNYICHLLTVRRSTIEQLGGMRKEFDGAQDYDLVLRLIRTGANFGHIPRILYRWNLGTTSLSREPADHRGGFEQSTSLSSITNALVQQHLADLGIAATCSGQKAWPQIRYAAVDYGKVTIIVCTKDQPRLLRRCIRSIESRTDYPNYEILIIDNGSTKPQTQKLLAQLGAKHRVVTIPQGPNGFSFSNLNNQAVALCDGRFVLFLNDDTRVLTPNWLTAMTALATIEGVGAVGAKLFFPDGTLQHVGVIMGAFGWAPWHALRQRKPTQGNAWYSDRTHNAIGVTAACMLMQREIFTKIGGFNESDFAITYNDVDLCLRLRNAGLRSVVCCEASLIHYESQTRTKQLNLSEGSALARKYRGTIDNYWNPHFSRDDDRMIPSGRRMSRRLTPHEKPNVLMIAPLPKLQSGQWPTLDALGEALEARGHGNFSFLFVESAEPETLCESVRERLNESDFDLVLVQSLLLAPAVEEASRLHIPSIWHLPERLILGEESSPTSEQQFVRALQALPLPYRVVFDDAFCKAVANQAFEWANFQAMESVLFGELENRKPNVEKKKQRREDFKLPQDSRIFLTLLEEGQSDFVDNVVAAMENLLQRLENCCSEPILLIGITERVNAEREASLIERTKHLGSTIRVLRSTKDEFELLDVCDVLVTSATYRTRSLPILMALQKQIPLLSTTELVPSEVLFEGSTGFVVAPHTPRRLSLAMEQLTKSDQLLERMRNEISLWQTTRSQPEAILSAWAEVIREGSELHPRHDGFRIGKVSLSLTEKISPDSNFANLPRA